LTSGAGLIGFGTRPGPREPSRRGPSSALNCGNGRRRLFRKDFVLSAWPVDRPRRWAAAVNDLLGRDEFKPLRISVNRGRPLGEESWMWSTARRLGLQFTLRSPGRPRRKRQNQMSRYSRT